MVNSLIYWQNVEDVNLRELKKTELELEVADEKSNLKFMVQNQEIKSIFMIDLQTLWLLEMAKCCTT